jgi:hypothetical protein
LWSGLEQIGWPSIPFNAKFSRRTGARGENYEENWPIFAKDEFLGKMFGIPARFCAPFAISNSREDFMRQNPESEQ